MKTILTARGVALTLLTLGILFGLSASWAASAANQAAAPTPKPLPPAGPSTAVEFDARVAAGDARQQQYVREFVALGKDPRSLPRGFIGGSSGDPLTLRDAISRSDVIVRAQVVRTEFVAQPRDLPLTISTVRVTGVARGSAVGSELKVVQRGGPVPQPNSAGGALAQLETDELLLTGDDVVLFLRAEPRLGGYQTIGASGIYFIRNGGLIPEEHNPFARTILAKTWPELAALVRQLAP